MEITEARVVLKEGPDKKLKAYATLTFDDCFVVRNVKIIKGTKGLFVAMPSRKMRESCPKCNYKNAIRSRFCSQCGSNLPIRDIRQMSAPTGRPGEEARQSEHRDIAHPITLECREYIQKKVLEAYEVEIKRAPRQEPAARPLAPSKGEPSPSPRGEPTYASPLPPPRPEPRSVAPEPVVNEAREEEKPKEVALPPEEPGDLRL